MRDQLIVRDKDHAGELELTMPSVACGICGASAQIPAAALGVEHWDELYGGDRRELDDVLPPGYSALQWEHDRALEGWSQEHAATHSETEHRDHHERQRAAGVLK